MKLVLVVGPPRSGTSFLARVLHERLGVCMGHNMYPPNEGNPLGFFEDPKMVRATQQYRDAETWHQELRKIHGNEPLIGVKTPELAFVPIKDLKADVIVRTARPLKDIANSIARWQQPKIEFLTALQIAIHHEDSLNKRLKDLPYLEINLDHKVSEEFVVQMLEEYIAL